MVATGPPDVVIEEDLTDWPDGLQCLFVRQRTVGGMADYRLFRAGESVILRVSGQASFIVSVGRIGYRAAPATSAETLTALLFSSVFSIWLELIGSIVLHGSTVDVGGQGVAFLARSGRGKSSLAAEFLRSGWRLLGDDHAVVERHGGRWVGIPALPWINVNRDLADYLGAGFDGLDSIHPNVKKRRLPLSDDQRAHGGVPLGRIVVLDRRNRSTSIRLDRMEPKDALRALVEHSAAPRSVEAAGLQPERLPLLAELVNRVGVWRLSYQSGYELLPAVRLAAIGNRAL